MKKLIFLLFFILACSLLVGAKTYNVVPLKDCINASINITISNLDNRYSLLGCTYNKTTWLCNKSCEVIKVHLSNDQDQILKFKIGYYYNDSNKSVYRFTKPVVYLTSTTTTTTTTTTTLATLTTIPEPVILTNNTIIKAINDTFMSNVSNIVNLKKTWFNNQLVQLITLLIVIGAAIILIYKAVEGSDGIL